MTQDQLEELFKKHSVDELCAFDRVEPKRSQRADLHAMLLLDELVPAEKYPCPDLICSAEHDQVWFGIDLEELAKVITEEQVLELVRCGLWIDDGCSLTTFV